MYPGTGKPPVAPKPKLHISVISPGPPRKGAFLPPVSQNKVKPAVAPKPKSLVTLIAVESKPAISTSLHNKSALGTTKNGGLLKPQNGVKDGEQNSDCDNITPVCLYCDGRCSCSENANEGKTEEDHKVFQTNKEVSGGQEKLKHAISNNQTYATTHKTFNNRDASSPIWTEKVTDGRVLIQSLLDRRLVNGTVKTADDQEPLSKPMSGTPTKPVPVPRKPRTAAPVHQEKAMGERQITAVEKEREVNAKERKKPSDGKGGSSLSVSAPERENKQQTQPAPPPRKKPFLSEPKKDPNSALQIKEAQDKDTSWDSSIYDMEVSVDKEDSKIYKEGAGNQEAGGFLLGSLRCRPVRTPVPANEIFKETPKKPLRHQPPRKKSFKEEHKDKPIGHQTRQVYTNQDVFKNGGTNESPPPNMKPSGNMKSLHLSLTKSKAKSFSVADTTCSEGQKRSSFRKLLDSKLTITILSKPMLTGVQGTTTTVNHSGPSHRQHHFDRKHSFPQTGFEQNVDGDQSSDSDQDGNYNTIDPYESYYEGNYMNVPLRQEQFSSGSHSRYNGDEEGIYEFQDPYSSLIACAEDNRTDVEQAYPNEIFSDFEADVNSSEEDEGDDSSTSSKGDPELAEAQSERMKNKIQYIAKEIMTSESVFVDVLRLLHVDFRESVNKASSHNGKPIIEERLLNQILYYLPQLYELNQDLLRELKQRVDNWDDDSQIADIFLKKGPYLKMYSTYIREFDKNVALLEEQSRKNPAFGTVVREFEKSPRCANLALKHYLLKPVQRIPQYQLLLTDYLKNLSEGADGYEETKAALSLVKEVANHANDIIKHGDNFQKLIDVQHRLNGNHQIIQPGRIFIKEGVLMKLSRKVMQPRMFFLFNDILLYTKPVQTGQYKLKNMLSLAGMKVSKPNQEAYQNELNIESVERSFILSGSSAAERDEWLDSISAAINEFTKKKISFLSGSSPNNGDVRDGAPLGSKAPIWIPDPRTTMCMICTSEFTLTWRRHHCRACGKVVCQGCSSNRHYLQYLKKSDRVCDLCFQTLKRDLDNTLSLSPGVKSNMTFQKKQKRKPAALKEVSANTDDSAMSGYLQRSKHKKKQWKRLWFVIKDKVLYTYAASEDVAAMESQPLLGFVLKYDSAQQLQFRLFHKNTLYYNFKADDVQTAQRWISSFKEATVL